MGQRGTKSRRRPQSTRFQHVFERAVRLGDRRRRLRRKIVDQDVERAELLDRVVDDLRQRISIGKARGHAGDALDVAEVPFHTAVGSVDGDDVGAVLDQRARDGFADAARGSEYHRIEPVKAQGITHEFSSIGGRYSGNA